MPRSKFWALLLLSAVALLVIFVRVRLAPAPLERDEGEYAYAGQLILDGIPPYQLAYNMKLPGTYVAYALLMAALDQTAVGIHLGLLIVVAAGAGLTFCIGNRLFGAPAGAAAAACFGLLTLGQGVFGLAAHATQFVVLAALAGSLLLLQGRAFWSGVAFGVAFLMKQPGLTFALFGAAWLVTSGATVSRWRRLASFSAGCILPYAIACLVLWRAGVFQSFWVWTVTYARLYAGLVPLSDSATLLRLSFPGAVGPNLPIWLMAAAGIALGLRPGSERNGVLFVAGMLAAGVVAACSGGYFRPHYYIVLFPSIALAVGAFVSARQWNGRAVPVALLAAALCWSVVRQSDVFFRLSPLEYVRTVYYMNPFAESVAIGDYIRAHSDPGARVAVLGSEPQIYFYAQRKSASGYIYMYPMTEPHPLAGPMLSQMLQELDRAQPEWVVFVNMEFSWISGSNLDALARLGSWVQYNPLPYRIAGLFFLDPDDGSMESYWEGDNRPLPYGKQADIIVYRRD